jgi:hypothetical protein
MFKKDDAVYLKEDPSVVGMVKSVDLEKGTCRIVWAQSVSVEAVADLRPADLPHYCFVNKVEYDVLIERKRQRAKWTVEHDAEHKNESLSAVASSLAHPLTHFVERCGWHDRRQRLVIAAALILAEIERIDREAAKS